MSNYVKKSPDTQRDYKERFEFRLTVGDNIICQRYFKISNFNNACLKSYELAQTIRYCGDLIDKMLKEKTLIYLDIVAPRVFNTLEEMNNYFSIDFHRDEMEIGHGIVVKSEPVDYVWGDNEPVPCKYKFPEDLASPLTDEDRVNYKFAFLVDGVEACACVWEGIYPKYIRHSIDLSNKGGRYRSEDASRVSFEQYLDAKLVEGRSDMVWHLINHICDVCNYPKKSDYTTSDWYGDTFYDNNDTIDESFFTKRSK